MDMLKKKTRHRLRHRLMMLSVLASVSGLPLSGAMAQEDPSSGNTASPSSEESATSAVSGTASSDYDGGGGGDYDAGGSNTGDYDGVSSAASDAGEGSGGGDIAGAGVADDEDAPKPMSNAELRALADKPTDAGEAPSEASMDAQEKLAEKHGGRWKKSLPLTSSVSIIRVSWKTRTEHRQSCSRNRAFPIPRSSVAPYCITCVTPPAEHQPDHQSREHSYSQTTDPSDFAA